MNIEMSFDTFAPLCDIRRDEWGLAAVIPDCIYDYVMELLEQTGGIDPDKNDPLYVVDNLAVNADWEDFEEFRLYNREYRKCSDEEICEIVEGEAVAVFKDEKIILWRTGL